MASTLLVDINGTTAVTQYDQVQVSGPVNLTGSSLQVNLGFTPAVGTSFTIIRNTSGTAVVGTFNNLPEGSKFTVNGITFKITYKGGTSGHDVVITRVSSFGW
jgi:hypothetical protein